MDKKAIVDLAYDLRKGEKTFSGEDKSFNASEAQDVLRKALIEANGGSAKYNRKTMRRNKVEIFEIIEELVDVIINEGLTGNEFWNRFVEYKNTAAGDKNEFYAEEDTGFVVTTIANGIATPRRQRLGAGKKTSIDTTLHAIRIYEEFQRFMTGIIDWNKLCDKVAEAFQKKMWEDIYVAFSAATPSFGISASTTGTATEDDLLELIADVEAATGKKAVIYGTQSALRKISALILAGSGVSDKAKDDMYENGYLGKFLGTDVFKVDQVRNIGSDSFMLADDVIYVIATDDKFIKFVDEGDTVVDDRDWTQNADMTLEYRMFRTWGVSVFFSDKGFGKYTIGTN